MPVYSFVAGVMRSTVINAQSQVVADKSTVIDTSTCLRLSDNAGVAGVTVKSAELKNIGLGAGTTLPTNVLFPAISKDNPNFA